MKLTSIIFWITIFASSILLSQTKKIMTLDEAINIALDKSFDTRSLGLRLESAEYGLNAAKGRFRTNAFLFLQTPDFQESVQEIQEANELPVFNTLGTTRYESRLLINQPLPTDGEFRLNSLLYHNNRSVFIDEATGTARRKEFYTSVKLSFVQPLFALNRLKTGLEKANLDYERVQKQFRRTQLDIVFRVTQSFYALYRATRAVEIAQAEVSQQKDSYDLAKQKYDAGLIPEVEALQPEVDYASSQNTLLAMQGSLKRQEDSFKQLIGLSLEEDISVDTRFDYAPFEIDEDFAIEQALKNRTELREREIEKRLAEISVKETDEQTDFKVEIEAFVDITGVSDPLIQDKSLNSLLQSSFDDIERRPKNKGIQLNVTVPLWDWGVNRNLVNQAKSNFDDAALSLEEEKKSVKRDVRSVISQVSEAQSRLEVLKKSENIAKKSYDISLARFENGGITSQELALDRERLTSARTEYLDAYITYKLAVANLKRRTLWDFELNQSLVED